jgi:Flp pilus assembly protein TadD
MRVMRVVPLLVLAFTIGCGSQQKPELTNKEKGRKQWNEARSSVLYRLAKEQFEAGNLVDCRKSLDQAASLNPDNPAIRVLSAKVAIEQGLLEPAERELREARTADPNNAEAYYLSGVIYQRWQKPQEALNFYVQATEKAPADLPYILARAEMLVSLDRRTEALGLLQERLTYFENSAAIRDAVGQLLVQSGKYAQAVPILKQATILATDEPQLREHLALAMFYAKQYNDAVQVFQKLLKEERYNSRADLITALGECYMQTNRPREARDQFIIASNLEPSSVTVWLNLGKVALQMSDVSRAELSLKKALSLDPNRSESHLMFGYLRLNQNKLGDALQSFRKASTLDPKDSVSVCMMGYVLEKLGKTSEAMKYYAQALRIKPNDELATTLMAQVQTHE